MEKLWTIEFILDEGRIDYVKWVEFVLCMIDWFGIDWDGVILWLNNNRMFWKWIEWIINYKRVFNNIIWYYCMIH
jgi:hypothetical protein